MKLSAFRRSGFAALTAVALVPVTLVGPAAASLNCGSPPGACHNTTGCNPMCGGSVVITSAGNTQTFTGSCNGGNPCVKILGSPSGLAHDNGNGFHVRLLDSGGADLHNSTGGIGINSQQEIWITDAAFSNGHASSPLKCLDPDVASSIEHPYLERVAASGGATFYPTFGAAANFGIQIKMAGDAYGPLGQFFQGRSVDVDADGDCDEGDENTVRAALGGGNMDYDFDWDSDVDSADLGILLTEALRNVSAGLCTDTENANFEQGIPGDYDPARNTEYLPTTISNLSVSRIDASTVRLSWTTPDEDGSSGRGASLYDVRKSASSITSGNFASAAAIASPPTPSSPGNTQTFDVSLAAGTSQYFAIKSRDDAGNWSVASNSPQIANTAPAAVSDLGGPAGREMVMLGWTAPGEDGSFGTATAYSVRYIQNGTISEANWGSATSVSAPTPGEAGTVECMLVYSLPSCTQFSFGMKTQDASGQWSALSNVKSATTKCSGSLSFECGGASMRRDNEAREGFELALGSFLPNPTRSGGNVTYSIPSESAGQPLELSIFDVTGRRRAVLASGVANAGRHSAHWDLGAEQGRKVSPGVYFMRLRIGETERSQPFTVAP